MAKRIRADIDDHHVRRVDKYAQENGLKRQRAYREIIEKGLDNQ